MAGFDLETQRSAKMPGMSINVGMFDISAGSASVDVPTTLARALFGMALADLTGITDNQDTYGAFKVGDVSDSKVTFIRAGGSTGKDARISYILAGY